MLDFHTVSTNLGVAILYKKKLFVMIKHRIYEVWITFLGVIMIISNLFCCFQDIGLDSMYLTRKICFYLDFMMLLSDRFNITYCQLSTQAILLLLDKHALIFCDFGGWRSKPL